MDYSAHDYNSLKRERDRLARRVDELKAALDRDKTGHTHALARVREIARMYAWIPAGEWGCYDYTKQTCETLRCRLQATRMRGARVGDGGRRPRHLPGVRHASREVRVRWGVR